MSHELRTPLNSIAGYTELLEMGLRGPLTTEQREDLGKIRRSQRHLLGLINDLMNFAKLEAGHVELDFADVSVNEIMAVLDALTEPQVAAKHVVLEPFVQVKSGFTREHDGVGLGLAISRDLARLMNGDLTVTSTVGAGSRFTLTLPRLHG